MTLQEWTNEIRNEYMNAGFDVIEHGGFPLVRVGPTFEDKKKFLEFRSKIGCETTIYSEGALLTPPGLRP